MTTTNDTTLAQRVEQASTDVHEIAQRINEHLADTTDGPTRAYLWSTVKGTRNVSENLHTMADEARKQRVEALRKRAEVLKEHALLALQQCKELAQDMEDEDAYTALGESVSDASDALSEAAHYLSRASKGGE